MKTHNQNVGMIGEEIAISYLKTHGYTILNHHFTSHWGELDIIAQKLNKLVFVEVKTRLGTYKGKPYEAISYFKLRSLKRSIQYYLEKYNYMTHRCSLDIISIILNEDFSLSSLQHIESITL